ncbi:MAG: hypothetical protein QGG40_03335 [Myxococcota bacterium]|nr:hypothetical protein [Myxococcota bacterium]
MIAGISWASTPLESGRYLSKLGLAKVSFDPENGSVEIDFLQVDMQVQGDLTGTCSMQSRGVEVSCRLKQEGTGLMVLTAGDDLRLAPAELGTKLPGEDDGDEEEEKKEPDEVEGPEMPMEQVDWIDFLEMNMLIGGDPRSLVPDARGISRTGSAVAWLLCVDGSFRAGRWRREDLDVTQEEGRRTGLPLASAVGFEEEEESGSWTIEVDEGRAWLVLESEKRGRRRLTLSRRGDTVYLEGNKVKRRSIPSCPAP